MAEPSRADESASGEPVVGENPEQKGAEQAESQVEATQHESSADESSVQAESAETKAVEAGPADTEPADAESGEAESADAEEASAPPKRGGKKGLLVGLGTGLVVGAVAGLAFAGLVKPNFLVGPGKPDDKASAVTAALAGKDASGLAASSCRGPDGTLAPQLPPEALQLIQSAKQSGPPVQSLDSEAVTPVELTLTAQGQTQTLPVDVVLGVTDGEWCMKGLSQRQQ
ncbi:hypothetical protein OU415_27075 [Saccharopolyspora sp. WRP15-2]|uniref:DUF4878 domain-containing protein n=1 Tax=Saccharopolyspora oryzae TaxID=2997343 RepID=A0ABT4V581_9PSEU|nr:hypothetical protein [Saccharopolyspora oryzae]MDA3629122.1 hypothetical protein [Saccharopolyspora oryzae]